jgi:hypothetical protein
MSNAMQIRPIRDDRDHRAALAEIEKLWGASITTPEGDNLDVLVTLVPAKNELYGFGQVLGMVPHFDPAIWTGVCKMIRCAFVLGFFIAVTQVNAQVPAPSSKPRLASSPPISTYCLPASVAFLESDARASDEVKKCARGDTVIIPSRNASAVTRMCDFSKAIVSMNDNVVCVLVIPERVSK